jgi:hypothetical protein
MTDLEQRLRDAYGAAAATVHPDSIRGLHEFRVPARRLRPRRWILGSGLVVPLSAAAAVVALVLAIAVIVPALTTRHRSAAASEPGTRIPQFTLADDGSDLRVLQTVTGRVVGRISAPAGLTFTGQASQAEIQVAGTASDRTFFVLASPTSSTCRMFLYKAQLGDGGQPSLTRLPLTLPPGTGILELAASGDGRTAALLLGGCGKPSPYASAMQANGGIILVDLATGRLIRQWSYGPNETAPILPGPSVYLSADGAQLAFPVYPKSGPNELTVRMLATSAPSGTLDSVSHVAWRQPHDTLMDAFPLMALSPDGKTLYACDGPLSKSSISITRLLAFSATTGRQMSVLYAWPRPRYVNCGVVTTDPLSGTLLAYADVATTGPVNPTGPPHQGTFLFAVDPATGRVSPLPFSMPADGLAW